ncbi:MAG: ribosome biogenesis GTPase Der [Gammaproteobacteria bacterium]|nr:ribosome biogenesis GTPase Der [Gammaproteobacteria bacterium]
MTVVALVGRPNVGKSTLFNRLTGAREALVANRPGLTRDRQYGIADIEGRTVVLIDTGGLANDVDDAEMASLVAGQANVAIDESDWVVFLVNAREGLTAADEEIADDLRRCGARTLLVANKIDGAPPETALADFSRLGFGAPLLISAAHGRGIAAFRERLAERAGPEAGDSHGPRDSHSERDSHSPEAGDSHSHTPGDSHGGEDSHRPVPEDADAARVRTRRWIAERPSPVPKVAVVGRPNVGKSTLVNRLLGDDRQIVSETPGTTRDAVYAPFRRGNSDYLLIDTAGVRRRGRVRDMVEKFSVAKTLEALSRADVALVLIDAREGLVDQDLNILRYAADAGTGLILAVNKWDGLSPEQRALVRKGIDRRMRFAPWVPAKFISALRGTGVPGLMRLVDKVFAAAGQDASPRELTRILDQATSAHPPPAVSGRAIKLRFAHKVGSRPLVVAVHGNRTSALPASYVRYLENFYRDTLSLAGVPVKILLQSGDNPFAGKRNELTRRQRTRRQRVIRRDRRR